MLASVEVSPYALPFRKTYRSAAGQIDRREMVLLRVTTNDGLVCLGEAVPLSLRGGDHLETVVAQLRSWAARAMEGDLSLEAVMSPPARCAVATAVADMESQTEGVPLHELLGRPDSRPIRCNATIGADDPFLAAEDAAEWLADGFSSFKLKAGTGDDVTRIARTRDAVGPEAKIRVDANGAWSVERAVEEISALQEFDIELVEQPVPDLHGMAELKARLPVRVIADESITGVDEAEEAARIGACDGATVKLSKIGGLDPSLGGLLPVYLSSALDGPVGITAAAHVAQTLPEDSPLGDIAQGLATARLFEETIATAQAELDGDLLRVPAGPGLGVEIDESALDAFRL
jgi:L-alanine-DL-glutamate epimerase-like enolase superfamily enzyme